MHPEIEMKQNDAPKWNFRVLPDTVATKNKNENTFFFIEPAYAASIVVRFP